MRLFALFTGAGLGSGLLVWAMGSGFFSSGLAAEDEKRPAGASTVLLGEAADEIEILTLSEQDMEGDEQWEPDDVEAESGGEESMDEEEGSALSFTLFEFSYASSLLEEMTTLQQLSVDASRGLGTDVIFHAQNGDAAAQYRVGLSMIAFYFHEKDKVKQVRESWLTHAAERGYLPAQKLLYYLYMNGFGSDAPEPHKAISYLRAAAEQGDVEARAEYDYLASRDWIEEEEPQAGLERLRQHASMEKGAFSDEKEVRAAYSARLALGFSYALGLGELERDVMLSVRYFQAARELWDQDFFYAFLSQFEALEERDAAGVSWLSVVRELALAQVTGGTAAQVMPVGPRDEVQYLYGLLLVEGVLEFEGDTLEQGEEYLRAIAARHAGASLALALRRFDPWCEELESGDEQRLREACALYAQAQRLGAAGAPSRVARCYELLGEPLRAMELLQRSVDEGGLEQRANWHQLAELCLTHGLVERALDCYRSLAVLGDVRAVMRLAEMYHLGEHVPRDGQKVRGYLDEMERLDRWWAAHLRKAWAVE